jgi:hypothetical protein
MGNKRSLLEIIHDGLEEFMDPKSPERQRKDARIFKIYFCVIVLILLLGLFCMLHGPIFH